MVIEPVYPSVLSKLFTPTLFRNLSRYDTIKNLNLKEKKKLTVVPCTDENCLSFSLHVTVGEYMTKEGAMKTKYEELRFLDIFWFLPEKLGYSFQFIE